MQWDDFKTAFRARFIPIGLIKNKIHEFLTLKQGGRSVLQYVEQFHQLSQYAHQFVDTEEKKRMFFKRGLDLKLQSKLVWQDTGTLEDLISGAIIQENTMRQVEDEGRKRKTTDLASSTPPPKYCLIYSSHSGQRF